MVHVPGGVEPQAKVIAYEGYSKAYGRKERPAVQDLSLSVNNGEILGLVGLNGAGKTTMLRAAAGLLLPTSGTVRMDGHDIVRDKVAASRTLGIVPEFPNFEPSASALDLLEYLGGYHGLAGDAFRAHALALLTKVGLTGNEGRKVGTFSQGMKKRFALAAALLAHPRNLLLDEILNGLDPEGIRFVRRLLLELRTEGSAILLSSHILSEVESVADRIAVLHKGRLLECVPLKDIYASRAIRLRVRIRNPSPEVAAYLSSVGPVEREGESFSIAQPHGEVWEVNTELVRRGAQVAEIRMDREDLESYFFRTIGEEP